MTATALHAASAVEGAAELKGCNALKSRHYAPHHVGSQRSGSRDGAQRCVGVTVGHEECADVGLHHLIHVALEQAQPQEALQVDAVRLYRREARLRSCIACTAQSQPALVSTSILDSTLTIHST